ncbi:MAG: hypothetical protein Q7V88_08045 [Actinomycetota bacterium]|nr:hypothetical protein [Actinomycetota bacterium]
MKTIRWAATGLLFGMLVAGSGRAANAELSGACQASGTWRTAGISVDAAAIGTEVVTIPRSDTVDWQGSVSGPPGVHHGSIWVELPPPFGSVEIDSWGGQGVTTSNSGAEEYDLPKIVPAGVEFQVVGEHVDANGTCSGSVRLRVSGGAFDSPLVYVSLLGTVGTGAGAALMLRPMFRRVAS